MEPIYVPGYGNSNAKILICAEAPGRFEEENVPPMPLIGPSGKLLNEFLEASGIQRSEVYCTNVVKIRPPDNKLSRLGELGKSIEDYLPQLWQEIQAINPNVIIALGNVALKALTGKQGILNYRGSILTTLNGKWKVIPTIHPAAFLHLGMEDAGAFKYSAKYYVQNDFRRAVEESKSQDINLPSRLLEVCRNSLQLHRFLDAYRDKPFVSIDIETVNCIPVCIGLAFTKSHALSVPLFNAYDMLADSAISDFELANIWQILTKFFHSGIKVVGQNFKFDHEKLHKPCGFNIAGLHSDTMFMASIAHAEFPKSLQFLTSIYTREPYYKDEGKEFNPKKDKADQLFIYNAKDAVVTIEIYDKLLTVLYMIEEKIKWPNWVQDFFFNYVMRLHDLYMDIESNGIRYDKEANERLWIKYSELEEKAEEKLEAIVGIKVNSNSPKQVAKMLETLKFPHRSDTGEDTIVALLMNHCKTDDQSNALKLILDLRRYKKTKSTYLAALPDYDGRMRTSYKITGTETGRTSTTKLKPPVRPHPIGLAFQTMTKHGDIGNEIREMLIPDPGYVFVECDLSQAEARIVALLSDDSDTLNLFNTTDIHKLTASWCFGNKVDQVTDDQRFVGKKVRHAGNYDMRKRRMAIEVNNDARRFHINMNVLSEWKAGKILDIFHQKSPKIKGVFHRDVVEMLAKQRYLLNPYGRYRMFYERWGDEVFREAYAFIPQSTVADHLKKAMLRIKERLPRLMILLEAHDAFLCQVREDEVENTSKLIREEMEKEIDFSRCSLSRGKLIIPSDIQVGKDYRSMKKVKAA